MILGTGFMGFYAKMIGDRALLALAQSNLMTNLDRITKVRTHTYLRNNAQNEQGISHNFGAERFYFWSDTIIDCRHAPGLTNPETPGSLNETIENHPKYIRFKNKTESLSGGKLHVQAYCGLHRGKENMRFDIRHDGGAVIDFDLVRVGVKITAENEAVFREGLENIRCTEDPFESFKPLIKSMKKVPEPA